MRGIQTSTRGWHCGRFQEPAQQLEKAISQWQQQLHFKRCREHHTMLTLKWWGTGAGGRRGALHHEGQAWRKAGPGLRPKRSEAAGGWHPSWGRLTLCLPRAFQGVLGLSQQPQIVSVGFSEPSPLWKLAEGDMGGGEGQEGRWGGSCSGGGSPAFLLLCPFCVSSLECEFQPSWRLRPGLVHCSVCP